MSVHVCSMAISSHYIHRRQLSQRLAASIVLVAIAANAHGICWKDVIEVLLPACLTKQGRQSLSLPALISLL